MGSSTAATPAEDLSWMALALEEARHVMEQCRQLLQGLG